MISVMMLKDYVPSSTEKKSPAMNKNEAGKPNFVLEGLAVACVCRGVSGYMYAV